MSKNKLGKLVGHLAVFSLTNIPPKTYNNNPQELKWTTLAPMPTPTTNSTSNPSSETITAKSKKSESLLLILASISIIEVFSIEILVYPNKYGTGQ